LYHKDNEFADRIARNQLLVLKTKVILTKWITLQTEVII
jgi:hypothetical protein